LKKPDPNDETRKYFENKSKWNDALKSEDFFVKPAQVQKTLPNSREKEVNELAESKNILTARASQNENYDRDSL
jgi:hypothetical protein